MDRHAPEFKALVDRIAAGEITREQAAQIAGIPLNTLKTWMRRSGLLDEIKHMRRNAGVFHPHAESDPDKVEAYAQAIAAALKPNTSVRSVAKRFASRGVSYKWLLHKVAQARAGSATIAGVPRETHPDNVEADTNAGETVDAP